MKNLMGKLAKASIIGLLALMGGCSRAPMAPCVVHTYTIHVSLGETSSRALTEEGIKTFSEGDQIAVIYQNESHASVKVVSEALSDSNISLTGKEANFTISLTDPLADGALRYIYPANMAATTVAPDAAVDADDHINYAALSAQDGTLASLASDLDLAIFDGVMSGTDLPENPILYNRLTIGRFTLMNNTGSSQLSGITRVTISDGTHEYVVSSTTGLPSPFYVAMRPISAGSLTFSASNGNSNYEKAVTGKTLNAGSLYPVLLLMQPVPLSGGVYNGFLYDGLDSNGKGHEIYEW